MVWFLLAAAAVGGFAAWAVLTFSRRRVDRSVVGQLPPGQPPTSMLAVQVVLLDDREVRGRIADLMSEAGDSDDLEEKRSFFRNLTALLQQYEHSCKYAYWEAFDSTPQAPEEFRGWVEDIETHLALDDQELGDEVDGYRRLDAEKSYVAVAVLALVADALPPVPDTPESGWVESTTVWEALEAFRRIDYRHLLGDAIYVMPANEEDGLSELDLADEAWSHLLMVQ